MNKITKSETKKAADLRRRMATVLETDMPVSYTHLTLPTILRV